MNYIDEIFTRLDVQCVREFLLHGGESAEIRRGGQRRRLDFYRREERENFYDIIT